MPEVVVPKKKPVTAQDVGGVKHKNETYKKNVCPEKYYRRPEGLTEVRRDNKDTRAVREVIEEEFEKCSQTMDQKQLEIHMKVFSSASWSTMESLHQLMVEDNKPENERIRMDKDHWFEINLANFYIFSNLDLNGVKEQLVPGRLFTTRMPRDLVGPRGGLTTTQGRNAFLKKCKENELKVICVLTEEKEFKEYSGRDDLPKFYEEDCKLTVYNRAIEDFKIPKCGDLIDNIKDLTHHLSQGRNCLVHCAGGTGRTGMVVAAILQNLGVYDAVAKIRRVKSTYVEKPEQEKFLKELPKAMDKRIIQEKPQLARAIAAEHLIQVFHTYGSKDEVKDAARAQDDEKKLEKKDQESLKEAYGAVFDLLDTDSSGTLDNKELLSWFTLCRAEIDVTEVKKGLVGAKFTKKKFVELMCTSARANRREY